MASLSRLPPVPRTQPPPSPPTNADTCVYQPPPSLPQHTLSTRFSSLRPCPPRSLTPPATPPPPLSAAHVLRVYLRVSAHYQTRVKCPVLSSNMRNCCLRIRNNFGRTFSAQSTLGNEQNKTKPRPKQDQNKTKTRPKQTSVPQSMFKKIEKKIKLFSITEQALLLGLV
jgi:hypothetical protein